MASAAVLRASGSLGTINEVDDEATQLVLETLFEVKVNVSERHAVVVGIDDEDGNGEEEEEEDS